VLNSKQSEKRKKERLKKQLACGNVKKQRRKPKKLYLKQSENGKRERQRN
jgi:hypothetical protein